MSPKTYYESIVERGENVSNTENMLSLSDSRAKSHILFLRLSGSSFRLSPQTTQNQKIKH